MKGWLVGLGVVGPWLVGCGDEHVVQWREKVVEAEGQRTVGAACATLGEGDQTSSGTGAAPPAAGDTPATPSYELVWEGLGDGVRLSIHDVYGELVEEHVFDEPFLDSGARQEITPALAGGGLGLVVWGGGRCEAIDSLEFE